MNNTNEVCNIETLSFYAHWHLISHLLTSYDVNKEGIECKVGNNANFVLL